MTNDTDVVLVIEPRRGWRALGLSELWEYRHLVVAFLARDIKATQKQTVLGFLWILISPLLAVATYSIIFGKLAKLQSDGVPYPVYVFAGQILWDSFATALKNTTGSVVLNTQFVQKVYFPRLVIPATAALTGVLNLVIVLIGLAAMLGWYGFHPTWHIALAVPILALVLATALGLGMLLAPLNVMYRDVGALTAVALQLGFYLTPVVYSATLIPARYRPLLFANPLAGYISAFRWSLYGTPLQGDLLISAVIITGLVLVAGAYFFARMQGRFADEI